MKKSIFIIGLFLAINVKAYEYPSCNNVDKEKWIEDFVDEQVMDHINSGTEEFIDKEDFKERGEFKWNDICGTSTSNSSDADIAKEDSIEDGTLNFSTKSMSCSMLLGENLLKVLKLCISALRIAGAIIVLVKASLAMIPAIQSGDDAAIKKATKQCISLAIILLVIGVFPTIIRIIGLIGGFDLSCL